MAIDSIGTIVGDSAASVQKLGLGQEDFLKILLTQLTFQDPLEPMDNQEFIVQMAQFTSLEQARQTNDKIDGMLTLESATQAIGLLGKTVQLAGSESNPIYGKVTTVRFIEGVPKVTFLADQGAFVDRSLSEIAVIREGSETPID